MDDIAVMNPKIETSKGWTEVIIDGDCEFAKFYRAGDVLQRSFQLTFTKKLDGIDTLYWDFEYKGQQLVLCYNIYEGVTVFPLAFKDATPAANACALEIGTLLYNQLNDLGWTVMDNGVTIGAKGSEGGSILLDISHLNGARITLEKDCDNAPFAITLGIYGLMFHTRFEGELGAANEYIMQAKSTINRIFDLYDVSEERRNENWQSKHDELIADL